MRQLSKQTKLIIGIALLIAAVSAVVAVVTLSGNDSVQERSDVSQSEKEGSITSESGVTTTDEAEPDQESGVKTEEIDPASLNTIEITPAGLTVSYLRGVGGFKYEVLRSNDGRKFIEFRNAELIGTKCEDDTGVFVSILESPNSSEQSTVAKSVDVEGVTYGLSVASVTCTSDSELLTKYQDAFVKPFSLLKKLN